MKPKNTLLLLVIAGAIFAFIYLFENKMPTSSEAVQNAGRVVQFDRDKITTVTIKNTETEIVLEKQKDGAWMMEKPLKDRADSMALNQLFTTAEALRSEGLASDEKGATKDQLREFGLFSSETRVKFTGGDKPVELLFGKDAAVENKLYVRLENSNVVHVIGNDLKTQVTKKVDEFRDHKLTDLTATLVNKVLLKTAAGEIELARKDQHWALASPLKARGDDPKIGDLIAKIVNGQIDSFVADGANLTAYGLQEPRGTATFFAEGSDKPVTLQIGSPLEKDKEKIYVKLSTRDAVTVVPKAIDNFLDTKPNDLRDRNLLRVEADIVDRINIEAAGKGKIVLARKGEEWVRKAEGKDEPVNSAAAARLLNELRAVQVTAFVSDVATELPKYGLDQPSTTITLSSYSSENTAETKAGERPIVSVIFGKVENGAVYAKLDDEPFVVSVPPFIVEMAMSDPLQWQELTIYKNKESDVASFEIARAGQPTLSFERDKDKKWALAKGDGKVNQVNVQSLVNTLASLRSVRWIGATTPEQGMDKPSITVTFKAGDKPGKLSIGGPAPGNLRFATADGLAGTFALSLPDATAFELPLIDKPVAAPATPGPVTPPGAETPVTPSPAPLPEAK